MYNAFVGKNHRPKSQWVQSTFKFLKAEEPMICMSYFPVVIKRIHIYEFRLYVEKLWRKTFDEKFMDLIKNPFSQFNILCTYLFWNKRDEYVWLVEFIYMCIYIHVIMSIYVYIHMRNLKY